MGTPYKHLGVVLLMSTHNICFHGLFFFFSFIAPPDERGGIRKFFFFFFFFSFLHENIFCGSRLEGP